MNCTEVSQSVTQIKSTCTVLHSNYIDILVSNIDIFIHLYNTNILISNIDDILV